MGLSKGNIQSTKTYPYFHPRPLKETPIQRWKNQILEDINTSTHITNQIKMSSYYKEPTSLFARNYETTHAEISSTYYKEKL